MNESDPGPTASLMDRLEAALPSLTPKMASATRHILAYPDDIAVFSMRELARRVDVPASTLVRLAQRIGFPGYDAMRRSHIEAVRVRPAGLGGISAARNLDSARAVIRQAGGADGLGGFIETVFAAEHEVLRLTLAGLREAAVGSTVALLAEAPRVFVAGRRTAFGPAYSLAYMLQKIRPGVRLLGGLAGISETELEDAAPGDVFVAVTFAPLSRRVLDLAEQAALAGSRIIVITDSTTAALRRLAGEHLLLVSTRGAGFLDATGGAIAVANLLTGLVLARLGVTAERRVARNEQHIVSQGDYVLAARLRGQANR